LRGGDLASRSAPEAGSASPASESLARLERALGRASTTAERTFLQWLSPPSAEVRRLAPVRALLRSDVDGLSRRPGGEVGTIRLGAGRLAIAVGSRLHVASDDESEAPAGLAQSLVALASVGAAPVGAQIVVYAAGSWGRTSAVTGAALRAMSELAVRAGVPLLGSSLHFAPEYGDSVITDAIAIGWLPEGAGIEEERVPAPGDLVVALAGGPPDVPRSDAVVRLRRILADLARDRVPVLALPVGGASLLGPVLGAIGSHGLRLDGGGDIGSVQATVARGLDPSRGLVLVVPPDAAVHVEAAAADRGGRSSSLGAIEAEGDRVRLTGLGGRESGDLLLPIAVLRERPAPAHERPEPDDAGEGGELRLDQLPEPDDYERTLRQLLRTPNLASRRWLHERFDSYAGAATLLHPACGAGASILRLRDGGERVALALSGNPRFSALDPYVGFGIAVCEGIRSLATRGARATALAATARFGRGDDADTTARAEKGLAGLRDAARAFGLPCIALGTGTSRSDAEEPVGFPLFPTVGCIGSLERDPVTPWFKHAGDVVLLLGRSREEIGGSEFAAIVHGSTEGNPPWIDFEAERSLQELLLTAAERGLLRSARSLAGGGLALAVVESCCALPEGVEALGAHIRIDEGMRPDAWLFAESEARVLVSVRRESVAAMRELADTASVPFAAIGEVAAGMLEFGELISLELEELRKTWGDALGEALGAG